MQRADVTIRAAGVGDAHAVIALLEDLSLALGERHLFHASTEDIDRFAFGEKPHFNVLLAEHGGASVGLAVYFYGFSTWRGRLGVYVQDLHVIEHARGIGLGRRLLASAAARGRRDGCTHLRLSVAVSNVNARAFYERVGLACRTDEDIFQISGRDFDRLAAQ